MKKHIIIAFLSVAILTGCTSWLNVEPSDRITEDVTFGSVQGFQTALNGVYIELNTKSLYGEHLTYKFMEIMARRYAINSENEDLYKIINNNDYTSDYFKNITTSIWSKAYTLIANVNMILKNCETNRAVLDNQNYGIIKGEALALRAMLHFDMLRLFGPIPSNIDKIAIPYYTSFDYNKKEREPYKDVIGKVLADLEASAELLKDSDPIIKDGINNSNSNPFLNFRTLRLNYYAVKGLYARALLYNNQKEDALIAAKEIIAVSPTLFPFTLAEKIAASEENPDIVFSSEALFSLQTMNRSSIDIVSEAATIYSLYTNDEVVSYVFNDEPADYRFKSWFKDLKSFGGSNYYLMSKYRVGNNSSLLINQMIPLLRISEIYYIAAECETKVSDGLSYLNTVKLNRAASKVSTSSASTFKKHIEWEYMRELWGDGQLFYYYKRTNKISNIVSPYELYESMSIPLASYVIPIPDGESDFN